MDDEELDNLMSDTFLKSLDSEEASETNLDIEKPIWVKEDQTHTTYRAWSAILKLIGDKRYNIIALGKVTDDKTPKSIYQIKKSEVSRIVGISAQSIFCASSFSSDILKFFNEANFALLQLLSLEQKKQAARYKKTGISRKRKVELVDDVQSLRERVRELECKNVKETLDILISQLPFDLQAKLKR